MRAFLIFSCLLLSCLFPSPSAALTDKEMCTLYDDYVRKYPDRRSIGLEGGYFCRSAFWEIFVPLPLKDLLNPKDRKRYDQLIDDKNCSEARQLLATRFVAKHTGIPSILKNARDLEDWSNLTLMRFYPDVGLCIKLEEIAVSQREIDKAGIDAKPFRGYAETLGGEKSKQLTRAERKRHLAIFNIFGMSHFGTAPILQKAMLKLSLEGVVVNFHPDYEYYLAYFLERHGITNDQTNRVLKREMPTKRRHQIESLVDADIEKVAAETTGQKVPQINTDDLPDYLPFFPE